MSGTVEYNEKGVDTAHVNELSSTIPHHFDAETMNIGGEVPLHPAPKGPHESIDDLKDELELEEPELDLYKPFPIDKDIPEEENILTLRGKQSEEHGEVRN